MAAIADNEEDDYFKTSESQHEIDGQGSQDWTDRRSAIRRDTLVNENVRISLQGLDLLSVKAKIEGVLLDATSFKKRQQYKGLLYIIDELSATNSVGKSKGILLFSEAYDLYCSAFDSKSPIPDEQNFRDILLSAEFGLPVAVFLWEGTRYVVLDPQSWDIANLLELFYVDSKQAKRFDLNAESLQSIINSMETEYDRSVVRALIAATSTRREIFNLGIKPDVAVQSLERILVVAQEVENALVAGKDLVILSLKSKIEKRNHEIESLNIKVDKLKQIRADSRHIDTLMEQIDVKRESLQNLNDLLECKDDYCTQRFNAAAKLRAKNLIEGNRMRKRASGAGAKRKLDELDEELIAKAIEQKTTAHGRRHDMVLYYHKRIKRDDLLNIANYNLLQQGKSMIKSATTVYNRAKPKRKSSLQAKKHIGKGLFCSKKPPKTENGDNILTHHQRKHVELAKFHLFSSSELGKFGLDISFDDKAYIRPETSVGMDGTKHQSLLQPTPESDLQIKALPGHDFCDNRLYITPSSYRLMTHELKQLNGKEQVVLKDDNSLVTVRPKFYIGSSGSVWASEFVFLRWQHPNLFEIENIHSYDIGLRKYSAIARDILFYFVDTTEQQDIGNITEGSSCAFRAYEISRLRHTINLLCYAQSEWAQIKPNLKPDDVARGSELFDSNEEVVDRLRNIQSHLETTTTEGNVLWISSYIQTLQIINKYLNQMKLCGLPVPVSPRILFHTDKGPGVSITNVQVKLRDTELVRMYGLDWHMRIHFAVNDPCPAERTNACIGDAVADGGSLPFSKVDLYKELDDSELEQLSSKELDAKEEKMTEANVWSCCQEVSDRIDDSPGPHGYMSAHVTPTADLQFFNNSQYYIKYNDAKANKEILPGSSYFSKIQKFMDTHYDEGENYREFLKCQDKSCTSCTSWIGPQISRCPRPFPDNSALPEYHYLPYRHTPTDGRSPDDWQPRVQLQKEFDKGQLTTSNAESVSNFADKFIVKNQLVLERLHHLEKKEFKKRKRMEEKAKERKEMNDKQYGDYNWHVLVQGNTLSRLKVQELNKYLTHHKLNHYIKMRKEEKVTKIREHWSQGSQVGEETCEVVEVSQEEEESDDEETDDEEEEETNTSEEETESEEEQDDIVLAIIGQDESRDVPVNVASRRSGRTINRMENSDFLYF